MPVGPDASVVMDKKNPYVGEWSPLVRLEAATPHGISQAGLALRAGRAYTGRVALSGSPGAKVSISLIWGPNPGDRQTMSVPHADRRLRQVSPEVHRPRPTPATAASRSSGPAAARSTSGPRP